LYLFDLLLICRWLIIDQMLNECIKTEEIWYIIIFEARGFKYHKKLLLKTFLRIQIIMDIRFNAIRSLVLWLYVL